MFNRKKIKELEAQNSFLEMMVFTSTITGAKKFKEVNALKKELSETQLELAKVKQENVKLKKDNHDLNEKEEGILSQINMKILGDNVGLMCSVKKLQSENSRLKEDLDELGKRVKEYESKNPSSKKTINVKELKERIEKSHKSNFNCHVAECSNCIFDLPDDCDGQSHSYDWKAIFSHDFGDKTEVTIADLAQFKRG